MTFIPHAKCYTSPLDGALLQENHSNQHHWSRMSLANQVHHLSDLGNTSDDFNVLYRLD